MATTDEVECEYHEVLHQRGQQCPECLRCDEDGEPRYQRKVSCPRCGAVTNYDATYGDLCPRHIRAENE